MIVRPATEADLPVIVDMAAQFYATTSYVDIAPMSDEAVIACARMGMTTGTMLLADDGGFVIGMLCVLVVPFLFNPSVQSADEVVWWVDEEARTSGAGVALLRAIEPASKAAGASILRMMDLASSPPQAAALYARMGYALTERSYTKVL